MVGRKIGKGLCLMQINELLYQFIRSELEDAVGSEHVSTRSSDLLVHSVDYFFVSRMWEDRGKTPHGRTSWCVPVRRKRYPRSSRLPITIKCRSQPGAAAPVHRAARFR